MPGCTNDKRKMLGLIIVSCCGVQNGSGKGQVRGKAEHVPLATKQILDKASNFLVLIIERAVHRHQHIESVRTWIYRKGLACRQVELLVVCTLTHRHLRSRRPLPEPCRIVDRSGLEVAPPFAALKAQGLQWCGIPES